jgi:hypothetical protein
MKRLTVHVRGAKATIENRKNKQGEFVKVPILKNTLTFGVNDDDDINMILEELKENGLTPTKHYTSNIK